MENKYFICGKNRVRFPKKKLSNPKLYHPDAGRLFYSSSPESDGNKKSQAILKKPEM